MQVMGDSALTVAAPTECQVGRPLVTTTDLGANGILCIGVSPNDCGSACANAAVSTFYYTNAGTGATLIRTNGNGDFASIYGGSPLTKTFFRSGPTLLFFPTLPLPFP